MTGTGDRLLGLVLAGGRSRRMGKDKAALKLDGKTALERGVELLNAHCDEVFVSVRHDDTDALRARFKTIADQNGGIGPADGIASAMACVPQAAWLVVACDLPKLDAATLKTLIEQRHHNADATAFASGRDALPEPLCTVYESRALSSIQQFINDDLRCPRKMLLNMNTHLLPPADNDALANANTPDDWQALAGVTL
ncbi:MAG: molybdenum cofactor guanylyltransferase [Gammaproteobacteria bacterium]